MRDRVSRRRQRNLRGQRDLLAWLQQLFRNMFLQLLQRTVSHPELCEWRLYLRDMTAAVNIAHVPMAEPLTQISGPFSHHQNSARATHPLSARIVRHAI
jgi:hypothetical protein